MGSTTTSRRTTEPARTGLGPRTVRAGLAVLAATLVTLGGCARLYVSPLAPPPHRAEIAAVYDRAWAALVRALAKENVPLRAIVRDSGVIASDDFVARIGVYADCYHCASTGRFEANLLDAVRELVKE